MSLLQQHRLATSMIILELSRLCFCFLYATILHLHQHWIAAILIHIHTLLLQRWLHRILSRTTLMILISTAKSKLIAINIMRRKSRFRTTNSSVWRTCYFPSRSGWQVVLRVRESCCILIWSFWVIISILKRSSCATLCLLNSTGCNSSSSIAIILFTEFHFNYLNY